MRIRILVVAAAATIALLTAGTPTWAAPHASQPFADQAATAHLTPAQTATLQGKVNDYLKVVGGKQVALNRIVFSGGELRVALPGEAHPRNLEPAAIAASDPCNTYLSGWFCAFSATGLQGSELSWYTCATYNMPWAGYGSWQNDQTQGTRAQFLDSAGHVLYTTPGAYSSSLSYYWTPIFKIKIC